MQNVVFFTTRNAKFDGCKIDNFQLYFSIIFFFFFFKHRLRVHILTRSDTNQAAQLLDRSLKFWIYEVEVLYYPSSENKGADQLHGYRKADLRLCFRISRTLVFSRRGSNGKFNGCKNDNFHL